MNPPTNHTTGTDGTDPLIRVADEPLQDSTETRSVGFQVRAHARDLAREINALALEQREHLRDMAIHLLRDEVEISRPRSALAPTENRGFNPFGIGIPLLLAGGVMVILFPPIGLLLFAAAVIMMAWGLAAVLLVRR